MQLQHHLSLQQQELMQQLQLVQRQYLIHQGFVKPLQIDFQTQNHAHSPTTASILQNMPTELNEQQCIESIQKPMYHNSQESHLEESFQEPHLLSPFQQNNELQHEKKYDNKTVHKKMEELYDSNDEHQNPQIYSERTQDPDSNHYYEANVTISAAVTPAISELKKKQQQELQVSYSNIISSICVNKKESNNAEHQHQPITPALYNNGQQSKIQYPQTHHPLKQVYGSKSSELKVEDNNIGNDMFDNKSSSNVVSTAYINLQQKHDLYVTQSKQQEKHEHFQHRIRTATQPASYLTQAPLQFSTCNDHSAAVAVAAASINNTAVVASAGSSNFHNFFDVINSLGHDGCGSGEGRAGHHFDNFSTKKYYHPLYLHGVCRWPSCEMELDDVTSFIKHLNTDHSLNDCSTAQARVQMQVVSQLEIHLQKERDRLQAMLHHLYLTKQFLSPEKIELKDPNDDAFHSSSPNVGHINTTHPGSPILSSADITSIRKRISDKSPWTVTGEIQRNREFYKNADIRPPFTYASLIRQSIIESPDKQLTLNEIYNWFQNTFCYFRRNAATWKNAIRTNLSLHKCFVRYEDDFGSFWMVDDSEFVKRRHLSRGRPRKYESSLSPDANTAQCGGSGDEGFRFSEKQQEQGKHNINDVDDNNGGGNYGIEAGGTSYQRVSKDISKNVNKSNNKNKEGFKRENTIMGSGEDDGVDGGGVDNDLGGYRIRCNYETHNMQHESLSNSPTYGNGSYSPKLKNIWAYQPIALEDAAALTMNSHFLRHNYSNYRNTTAGFKQQHSSNHDRNFMHKHCVHHQNQHRNLHHLQQHYQYKQQTTSSQLPQLFLTQLERRCQNVSVNSNGGALKENFERQKHEERAYVAEECSGANDKLHNVKEPLLDLKLSPEDLTTIATATPTPTPTPKTALMLPTTTTDRNSPLSTVTEYITLRHPTDYGTDFQ